MANPVTPEQAEAVLAQVDIVKKQRGSGWDWRDIEIHAAGGASVLAKFNVSSVTVSKWFRQATANLYMTERLTNGWTRLYFDMLPIVYNDPLGWRDYVV